MAADCLAALVVNLVISGTSAANVVFISVLNDPVVLI